MKHQPTIRAVFVDFDITPVKKRLENDLFNFLLEEVWGDQRIVEESLSLHSDIMHRDALSVVSYQFPTLEDACERVDEVAYLLGVAMANWSARQAKEISTSCSI